MSQLLTSLELLPTIWRKPKHLELDLSPSGLISLKLVAKRNWPLTTRIGCILELLHLPEKFTLEKTSVLTLLSIYTERSGEEVSELQDTPPPAKKSSDTVSSNWSMLKFLKRKEVLTPTSWRKTPEESAKMGRPLWITVPGILTGSRIRKNEYERLDIDLSFCIFSEWL